MNANLRKLLMVSIATALLAALTHSAVAQSYLDGSAKSRGEYGQAGARSVMSGGGAIYRAPAPVIAQAPSATRSFSYNPAPANNGAAKAKSDTTTAPNAAAKKDTRTTRSYSYDPSYGSTGSSRSGSQTPLYLVPKSLR